MYVFLDCFILMGDITLQTKFFVFLMLPSVSCCNCAKKKKDKFYIN